MKWDHTWSEIKGLLIVHVLLLWRDCCVNNKWNFKMRHHTMKIWLKSDTIFPDNSKTIDSIIMKFSVLFLHIRCHHFKRVTAHLCDDLPLWQTCNIMWRKVATLIWASLNCVLLVTCSNLFSNIKKDTFLIFCVVLSAFWFVNPTVGDKNQFW